MRLTAEDVDTLTSYGDGEGRIRAKYKCTGEQLKDAALDNNVEKCPTCGWWTESCLMLPPGEDEPDGKCDNCR